MYKKSTLRCPCCFQRKEEEHFLSSRLLFCKVFNQSKRADVICQRSSSSKEVKEGSNIGEEYWNCFLSMLINHCNSWITQGGEIDMGEKNYYKLGIHFLDSVIPAWVSMSLCRLLVSLFWDPQFSLRTLISLS